MNMKGALLRKSHDSVCVTQIPFWHLYCARSRMILVARWFLSIACHPLDTHLQMLALDSRGFG